MSDTSPMASPEQPADPAEQTGRSEETGQSEQADRSEHTGEVLGGRADDASAASKPADEWVTGDEPITAAQKSYLDTLAREAGEELPADLTKAQASEHIERLQAKTGRGQS